jgi:type IV pilus assembly protein PilO
VTTKKLWLLILLAAAVPQLLCWTLLFPRHTRRISELRDTLAGLDRRVEQARAAERKLPQFREAMQRLNLEQAKLDQFVPPANSWDEVRGWFEWRAKASRIRIERFDVRDTEDRETHRQYPAEVEAVGSGEQLAEFLSGLANVVRVTDVSAVTLERDRAEQWRMTFLMRVYSAPP